MNAVVASILFALIIAMNLGLFFGLREVSNGLAWFVGFLTGVILLFAWRAFTRE